MFAFVSLFNEIVNSSGYAESKDRIKKRDLRGRKRSWLKFKTGLDLDVNCLRACNAKERTAWKI